MINLHIVITSILLFYFISILCVLIKYIFGHLIIKFINELEILISVLFDFINCTFIICFLISSLCEKSMKNL